MPELPRGRTAVISVIALVVAVAAGILLSSHGHGRATPPSVPSASQTAPAPSGAAAAAKTLNAVAFTSAYASGWTLTSKHAPSGAARYQLSSTATPPNALGIPVAGSVGVTIDVTPVSLLARAHFPGATGASPLKLLPDFVGTPRGAKGVKLASRPQRSRLGGAKAAIESYAYIYRDVANLQVDLLARHGHEVVLVELDTAPTLASAGEAALETLGRSWHWR
jgi:hypothetical protein